jgi:hypothetical protein
LVRLSFDLGFWLFAGAVVGFVAASSQVGESPLLTMDLSEKEKI